MERNINMNEVSDGKLYTSRDMVRVGCEDCKGCSACCHGMGSSIVLDPYDIHRMSKGLGCTFDELLNEKIELNIVDSLILPNLKMAGPEESCPFLDVSGRCGIHAIRPGICRLFPLGRIYENNTFQYFLQIHECKKQNRTKMKVSKWLDTPNLKQYEQFVSDWHYFLKDVENEIREFGDAEQIKQIGLSLLHIFYRRPYDAEQSFYPQFYERLYQVRE